MAETTNDHDGGQWPPPWLTDTVAVALLAAVDQDSDKIADAMQRIAVDGGARAMYGACLAWAKAINVMVGFTDLPDGTFLAIERVDATAGEGDPALWAARFVAASGNGDLGMCRALFDAAFDGDEQWFMEATLGLVLMAGDIGRQKLAERAGGDGGR